MQELFKKYLDNQCSIEEVNELLMQFSSPENELLLRQLISEKLENDFSSEKESSKDWTAITEDAYQKIKDHIDAGRLKVIPFPKKTWFRVAAAAILILLATGTFFLLNRKNHNEIAKINNDQTKPDIKPGGNKAVLTLGDNSQIILDNAQNGELAHQGNSKILKLDNGQLAYNLLNEKPTEVFYNSVTTPRGGQYQLTLSDGSKVWLNAASSIRFPVAFSGKERRIDVTGEVYVKVAHNPQQPFIASVNGMEVLALGTEFNINSYNDDENISATLIDGMVKVSTIRQAPGDKSNVILKPGQQAQLINNGELTTVKEVNIDEITAWKDGYFHFESADIKTILRQFARWYDIEVVYEGKVSDRKFFVIVKRSTTLKSVLEMLQDNNISYQIEGKKLVVKSN